MLCSFESRSRQRFRSARCTAGKTTWVGPCGCRFGRSCRRKSSASSRFDRNKARPARFSVSLRRLQRDLERPGQVNTILLGTGRSALGAGQPAAQDPGGPDPRVALVEAAVREAVTLEDLGIKLRVLQTRGAILMESDAGLLSDVVAQAGRSTADALGMRVQPILTYLANRLRLGEREVPYSLLTALDLGTISEALAASPRPPAPERPPLVLNAWAADDLAAESGDLISIEYYVWADEGRLVTREAEFRIASVVPLEGAAADRDLAPDYPGITEADSLFEWDPPFPIDLSLIGLRDEEYWDRYRATPKGFVPLEAGQALWGSRWGPANVPPSLSVGGSTRTNAPEVQRRASRIPRSNQE